jgi:hypothetical protein
VKSISLESEGLTLEGVLSEAAGGEVVFLTRAGEARFVLVSADESDREVMALRADSRFLEFLAGCEARARERPRTTLGALRASLGDEDRSGG